MRNILFILLITTATNGYAQSDKASSKRSYDLFHPVPKNQMRSFETDRPDATESPYTVDAGHFQVETDLFKTERTNVDRVQTINNFFNAANLKLGITNSLDVQLIVNTVTISKIKYAGSTDKESGFGGLSLRLKQNIWGNDGGKTAFGILPFINFPTTSSEKITGGIVFPFAVSLPHGWDLGTQFETDFENNKSRNNYHFNYLVSATTSHSITKTLDFFIEGIALRNNDIKTYEYFFDGGLEYALENNIKIDGGFYYGLKKISSKTYFVGISLRF